MRKVLAVVLLASGSVALGCVPVPDPETEDPFCEVQRQTIELALEAHLAVEGSYPAEFADLIGWWLDPDNEYLDWIYTTTGDGYLLVGPC